jgi:hypothetical protein
VRDTLLLLIHDHSSPQVSGLITVAGAHMAYIILGPACFQRVTQELSGDAWHRPAREAPAIGDCGAPYLMITGGWGRKPPPYCQ